MGNSATIPPPPAGFTPVDTPPPPPAGFSPVPPPPAGFTPVDTKPGTLDTARRELGELNTGFTSALSQTGLTAQKAIGAIPVIGPAFASATANARAQDVARAAEPMNTPGRMAGNAIENILEFAAGDEALKGASFLTKVDALQPLVQALKKSPTAVQVITNMMGQGVRNAALAAGQSAAHGNDPRTVRNAALVAGSVGAAAEPLTQAASSVIRAIKPTTVTALGEDLPALASQQPGAAPIAKEVANITTEPATAGAQQIGAQRALVTRAQQVTEKELNNLNAARQARWQAGEADLNLAPEPAPGNAPQLPSGQAQLPAATPTTAPQLEAGEPPSGLARTDELGPLEGDIPEPQPAQPGQTAAPAAGAAPTPQPQRVQYIEERPPNFQPIDTRAESQGVTSFGDAADKIREHAAPIYQRLNSATDGQFNDLRLARDQAYSQNDYNGVRDAEKKIDALFDSPQLRNQVDRTDYTAAKSAWRSSKILDAVHDAVSRGFNIQDPTLAEDAGVWRGLNGGKLMTGINRLTKDYGRDAVEQVLGRDGMTGLTRMASLLQTPRYASQYGQVIGHVADDVLASAASKGVVHATANWARGLVLHRIATDPTFSKAVEYAVTNRVSQRVATAALTAMLNQTGHTQAAPAPPTQDLAAGGQQ
jgi:hypothetical protein